MVNDHIQIGLYEKALPSHMSWTQKLKTAEELGFDFMEMSIDETDEKINRLYQTKEERCQFRMELWSQNIRVSSICLSALRRYALGSENEHLREKGIDIACRAIDLAKDLGIRMIQLPGYDVYYEQRDTISLKRFIKSLHRVCEHAAMQGILLGFETMENDFMDTIEKAMRYVDMLDSPYLQLYPDIGNLSNAMRLYGTSLKEDLDLGRGHILAVHLKETREGYYRNLNYGEGDCDFDQAIKTCLNLGVRRFVYELWYQGETQWKSILSRNVHHMSSIINHNFKLQKGGDDDEILSGN